MSDYTESLRTLLDEIRSWTDAEASAFFDEAEEYLAPTKELAKTVGSSEIVATYPSSTSWLNVFTNRSPSSIQISTMTPGGLWADPWALIPNAITMPSVSSLLGTTLPIAYPSFLDSLGTIDQFRSLPPAVLGPSPISQPSVYGCQIDGEECNYSITNLVNSLEQAA